MTDIPTPSGAGGRQPAVDEASSSAVITVTPGSIAAADEAHWRAALIAEAEQIQHAAEIWGQAYRRRAGFFHSMATYLALASALVATLAGGAGLTLTATVGAAIALTAAALAAISSALGATARTDKEIAGAIANTTLADAARVFATAVAPFGSKAEVIKAFDRLCSQRDAVVKDAPIESTHTLNIIQREWARKQKAASEGRVAG